MQMILQSLKFVAETKILVEMKIKNGGEKIISMGKNQQTYFFFYEN